MSSVSPCLPGPVVGRPTSQTRRPTIIFTNGYPDADATVQDVVERVERLRRSMEKRRDPPGSWASWLAGQVALHEAEAELRDLGVTP